MCQQVRFGHEDLDKVTALPAARLLRAQKPKPLCANKDTETQSVLRTCMFDACCVLHSSSLHDLGFRGTGNARVPERSGHVCPMHSTTKACEYISVSNSRLSSENFPLARVAHGQDSDVAGSVADSVPGSDQLPVRESRVDRYALTDCLRDTSPGMLIKLRSSAGPRPSQSWVPAAKFNLPQPAPAAELPCAKLVSAERSATMSSHRGRWRHCS